MHTISSSGYGRGWPPSAGLSRRIFAAGAAGALAACATRLAPSAPLSQVGADLETYVGFGSKNAGGSGDNAAGAWIEARLARAGFAVERHALAAIDLEERDPVLVVGETHTAVATHWVGRAGAFTTATGPIEVWNASGGPELGLARADRAIVIAHLQAQRWSSAEQPAIRRLTERAFAQGAVALVLITHGPTRDLIKLNRRLTPIAPGPIALMAPRAWTELEAALSAQHRPVGSLQLNAIESARAAFNVIGRLDRASPSTIVVSTPRSGWTPCGGERGPGVAAFLALAEWAPRAFPHHNLLFVCSSAHEFENAGAAALLESLAPAPAQTALWLHLGAGFAARDWHEMGGELAPLPSADPQRFLAASPQLIDAARTAFAGLGGLEAPYSTERGAAGELSNIIAAGYPAIIGMLGAHRYHHVAGDDLRCVEPWHVSEVISRTMSTMRVALAAS